MNVIYGKETYVGEVYEPPVDDHGHTTPIFVQNTNEWLFSINPKDKTYRFFYQELVLSRNPRMGPLARKHMWGKVNEPLVDDQWPHNPYFCWK
jgi:hypothetical protein